MGKEFQKYVDWGFQEIKDRGLDLLHFMEERWKISLGDINEKEKLLFPHN